MNQSTDKISPDAIWVNGTVLTLNPDQPQAEAISILKGKVLRVGSSSDLHKTANSETIVHDLNGQFIMPGLIDTHAHGIWGALRDKFEVYVGLSSSLKSLMLAISERASKVPENEWISGGPWHMSWIDDLQESPKKILDLAAPHHFIALKDVTYHTAWLNTAALKACGIDKNTPDPEGGRIGRDTLTGEPNGILYEKAQNLVRRFIVPSRVQLEHAVKHMSEYFHSLGLTGFKEAMASEAELDAYYSADKKGTLNLHVAAHMALNSLTSEGMTSIEKLLVWREQFVSEHVHTSFVKLFLDGVAPSLTASFLEPYLPMPGCTPALHNPDNLLAITPNKLAEIVTELDSLGLTVKMHAVGDRAARAGLDAVQVVRETNGQSGLRHEIGHTAFVHTDDHPRFKLLGMVADMSPRLWFPNPVTPGQVKVLGPVRTQRCHQIKSLMIAGAELTYGSDWPAAAADANPWVGLAGMISRRNPFGLFPGFVGEEQAISLEEALPLFTTQAARSMGLENVTGSLKAGMSADFIRLAKPLLGQSPEEIAKTKVLETYFEGRCVYVLSSGQAR
jgi:hypothetical protein